MPYVSKAQQRLFYAKEDRGELPAGTANRWSQHTKDFKHLPEHVAEKSASFTKLAADAVNAALVIKLASDAQLSPAVVETVIAKTGVDPVSFVKCAYADPAGFDRFVAFAAHPLVSSRLVKQAIGMPNSQGLLKLLKAVMDKVQSGGQALGNGISQGASAVGKGVTQGARSLGITRQPGTAAVGAAAGAGAGAGAMAMHGTPQASSQPAAQPSSGQPQRPTPQPSPSAEAKPQSSQSTATAAPTPTPETQAPTQQMPQAPSGSSMSPATQGMLMAGGAGLAGGAGYALGRRRARQQQGQKMAADRKTLLRELLLEKSAEALRKEAADLVVRHVDFLAEKLSLEKSAALRKLQYGLSTGATLADSIKVAYPHLSGEARGILGSKLVDSALRWRNKVANVGCGPLPTGAGAGKSPTSALPTTSPQTYTGSVSGGLDFMR